MSDMFEDAKAPGAGSPEDQGSGLGLDLPAAGPSLDPAKPAAPYTVLARKYRPQHFGDLIGQEAMVRTLGNAFSTARVHQAYIFTGVRGVGKTTTARILARAFNYELEDGSGGPTIDLKVMGRHCQAIIEGRHVDVIEMDAASHTGIGDIREIIESVRYRPAYARNKVYIIDEVHMLSTAAFNGLLKTLEEPPPHVKFLFATTEIRKVPITVLSRCQRFDLRRIEAGMMIGHLAKICAFEGVSIEAGALAIIARAAEGSVRDALSLLDQAIAHGAGQITADQLRSMLGLADRSRIIDLFEAVMQGDMAGALIELRAQYDAGADPAIVISDLADYVHLVTRLKLAPDAGKDPSMSEAERVRGEGFAADLPIRVLSRAWQILLKGLAEIQGSPRPIAAAEMVLVRLVFAADLPTPDEALRLLRDGQTLPPGPGAPSGGPPATEPAETRAAQSRSELPPPDGPRLSLTAAGSGGYDQKMITAPAIRPQFETHTNPAPPSIQRAQAFSEPKLILRRLEDFVALAEEKREIELKIMLERHVRPVVFEMGRFEFASTSADQQLANRIKRALDDWTGIRWAVALSKDKGEETLHERASAQKAEAERGIRADPLVRSVLEKFPGAQIVSISAPAAAGAGKADAASDETVGLPDDPDAFDDPVYTDDDL